jgi:hypothetical protein
VGRITIRVEREDFVLDASKQHETVSLALAEALQEDKAGMLKRKLGAEQDLRRRVAALSATKPKADDHNRPGLAQFDMFSLSFCIDPVTYDETEQQG